MAAKSSKWPPQSFKFGITHLKLIFETVVLIGCMIFGISQGRGLLKFEIVITDKPVKI